MRVLFVCLGNICRSPTAEGVLRHKLEVAGLADQVEVDSCGTGAWHVGSAPDLRAQKEARVRGIDISRLRGRQLADSDFERFDYMLAMDDDNLAGIERLRPPGCKAHVALLMAFAGEPNGEVPDPYYDGGFGRVYAMIESAADGLVAELRQRLVEPTTRGPSR
uniref:low molecular weight protein-tyrosine-phosphatase n=1 Tax=Halomonas sp. TaxID=1486246 RepID=UPI00261927F1|nr:low molecular weight protein-tyrosine-phosphatase [Halomonas sp.]